MTMDTSAVTQARGPRRSPAGDIAVRVLVYALILLGVAIVMIPFLWMLSLIHI